MGWFLSRHFLVILEKIECFINLGKINGFFCWIHWLLSDTTSWWVDVHWFSEARAMCSQSFILSPWRRPVKGGYEKPQPRSPELAQWMRWDEGGRNKSPPLTAMRAPRATAADGFSRRGQSPSLPEEDAWNRRREGSERDLTPTKYILHMRERRRAQKIGSSSLP